MSNPSVLKNHFAMFFKSTRSLLPTSTELDGSAKRLIPNYRSLTLSSDPILSSVPKKEEKTELQTRLERNQKGMRELEKKLNNYRKAIESGVDISLVIEPINALKSEKENLEGTNRELKARLENQPRPESFRFTKTAYDNFSEMIQTVINSGSVDNLRAFLQRFIQKILVYSDRISIIYLPTLIDGFNDPGSDDPYTVSMVPKGGLEPPQGLLPTRP